MQLSALTLRLLLLLVPGAIAAAIVEALTAHKPWTAFRFMLYGVLLSPGAYLMQHLVLLLCSVTRVLFTRVWIAPTLTFWNALVDTSKTIDLGEVGYSCFFAVALGYAMTGFVNHKYLYKTARLIGVSKRLGDADIWSYTLNLQDVGWVWVRDHRRGLVYEGWVKAFSDRPPIREILLSEVKVYPDYDDIDGREEQMYCVPAVYLSGRDGDFTIEIPVIEQKGADDEQGQTCARESQGGDREGGRMETQTSS